MKMSRWVSVAATVQIAVLAGCVPAVMAPTVVATPGPGKTLTAFAADHGACAALADQQIAVAKNAANNQIVGTALLNAVVGGGSSAAAGASNGEVAANSVASGVTAGAANAQAAEATLQQQYDVAYSACMYAKGDNVPGYYAQPVYYAEPTPTHRTRRRVAHKPSSRKTASTPDPGQAAGSGFVVPAPTAASGGGSGFVEPAPAATPAAASGSGFVQPAPSH